MKCLNEYEVLFYTNKPTYVYITIALAVKRFQ